MLFSPLILFGDFLIIQKTAHVRVILLLIKIRYVLAAFSFEGAISSGSVARVFLEDG